MADISADMFQVVGTLFLVGGNLFQVVGTLFQVGGNLFQGSRIPFQGFRETRFPGHFF
jgi:hypothetical protein